MKTFKAMITLASVFFAFGAYAAGETGQSTGKDPCASVTAKSGKPDPKSGAAGEEKSGSAAGSALGSKKD